MPQKEALKLKLVVQIYYEGTLLASKEKEASDKVFEMKREGGYILENSLNNISMDVVSEAIKKYNEGLCEKKN
jgi:hypothetical protein